MRVAINLAGRGFGRLAAVKRAPRPEGAKGNAAYWHCVCACGGSKVVRSDSLLQGRTKSCGCMERGHGLGMRAPRYGKAPRGGSKLTPGHTHGSLRVVSYVGEGTADELWRLDCICGKAKILPSAAVLSGGIADCGTCDAARERVSNAHLAELIARTQVGAA